MIRVERLRPVVSAAELYSTILIPRRINSSNGWRIEGLPLSRTIIVGIDRDSAVLFAGRMLAD
jgi:hypothetical protein